MYSLKSQDYTFSCIYQKMYNIANKYLQSAWASSVFPRTHPWKGASGSKKLYIFPDIWEKCIIGHARNIHFCVYSEKCIIWVFPVYLGELLQVPSWDPTFFLICAKNVDFEFPGSDIFPDIWQKCRIFATPGPRTPQPQHQTKKSHSASALWLFCCGFSMTKTTGSAGESEKL